jgi:hypothetical protein
MDAFDFSDDKPKKGLLSSRGGLWRIGTLYFIVGTLCLALFFIYTYVDPYNSFNPWPPPPPTEGEPVGTPTQSPTDIVPSSLPSPTITESQELPTFTTEPTPGGPTATTAPFPSITPFLTEEVTPTESITGLPHFKADGPFYNEHQDGCNGMYVAGIVWDIYGNPLTHYIVRVSGTLDGVPLNIEDATSGSAPQYDPSGWEVKISDTPIASSGTVYIELYSLESEDPISDMLIFVTYDDCSMNLILINFIQDQ